MTQIKKITQLKEMPQLKEMSQLKEVTQLKETKPLKEFSRLPPCLPKWAIKPTKDDQAGDVSVSVTASEQKAGSFKIRASSGEESCN